MICRNWAEWCELHWRSFPGVIFCDPWPCAECISGRELVLLQVYGRRAEWYGVSQHSQKPQQGNCYCQRQDIRGASSTFLPKLLAFLEELFYSELGNDPLDLWGGVRDFATRNTHWYGKKIILPISITKYPQLAWNLFNVVNFNL